MDMLDALSQTFDHATKVVAGVGADQLDAATPCKEWNVRALLGHSLGVIVNVGRGARGEELLASMNTIPLDTDLAGQFRAEADRTLAAWTTRGLDGEFNIGAGPMPAQACMSVNLIDTATHSWDIARATGQDGNLPDELGATVLAVAQGFVTDAIRGFAGFNPPVPVASDAGPTDQLVAFLGRRP